MTLRADEIDLMRDRAALAIAEIVVNRNVVRHTTDLTFMLQKLFYEVRHGGEEA